MTDHILFAGGTGFFGRAVLRTWLRESRGGRDVPKVAVFARCPERFLRENPEFNDLCWLRFFAGDVSRPASMPRSERFTHVIHAASDSSNGPMLTPLERYKQIVDGTRNLLTFAADNGARRFLFSSSGAVYGPQPSHVERLAEEFRGSPPLLDPVNAYGLGKHAAEHLCVLFRDAFGLETVIARCFAFVGPDLPLDRHFAIGNFIGDALLRDSITVSGDGTPIRTYLHQDDLAHWLLAILFRGCPGEAYNVGSDVSVSMSELAGMVRDVLAPGKPVRVLAAPGADNQRSRYVPRVDKIMRELGVTECIGLREALLSTGAHHRERLGLRDP